jgi:site-specific DNA recombinase
MRPHRVLAYVRVSSADQERSGTSLDGQREEIARHCAAVGWPAPRVYVEAESAGEEKLARRVQLRALLEEAQRGDAVVVAKQDRWSRDTLFFLRSVRELGARGVRFLALAERFDPDTPEGRFAATIMAAVAEQERDRIKVRTEGRRRALRDQGCWTEGVAPFGYRRDPTTRRLVVQPREAELVGAVYARCIAGDALPTIAAWLRDERVGRVDGPPIRWDRKGVHAILRHRWYLGEIRHTDGTWHPAHPPLVDRDVYDQAQRALASRRLGGRTPSSESRTRTWLLRGLASCASCGSRLGAAYSRHDSPRGYYACAARLRGGDCDEPYARVDQVDELAGRAALRRLEEMRHLLAQERVGDEVEPDEDRLGALRGSLEAAKIRRGRVVSLHVDGTIDREELRRRVATIDEEIGRLEGRIAEEGRRARLTDPSLRAEVLADVERLRLAWAGLNVEARRAIVQRLVERIEIRNGRPEMQWRSVESLGQATVDGRLLLGTVAESRGAGGSGR